MGRWRKSLNFILKLIAKLHNSIYGLKKAVSTFNGLQGLGPSFYLLQKYVKAQNSIKQFKLLRSGPMTITALVESCSPLRNTFSRAGCPGDARRRVNVIYVKKVGSYSVISYQQLKK